MEASNDSEKKAAFQQFNDYILAGWDEDIGFAIPSRASERARTSQEVPPGREYSDVVFETGPQPKSVNVDNVKVFIENWAKKVLVTDTANQTSFIREGMEMIAGLSGRVVSLSSADDGLELFQRMIQGSTNINIGEWQRKTKLEHGQDVSRTEAEEMFRIFWEVVGDLNNEDSLKLMNFWGLQVLPAGGFAALTDDFQLMVRDRCNKTTACIPKAAACLLQLRIPYPVIEDQKEAVRSMIGLAIAQPKEFQLT